MVESQLYFFKLKNKKKIFEENDKKFLANLIDSYVYNSNVVSSNLDFILNSDYKAI